MAQSRALIEASEARMRASQARVARGAHSALPEDGTPLHQR
jgi:hypothetical protein